LNLHVHRIAFLGEIINKELNNYRLDFCYIGLHFGSLQVKIKMTFIQKKRRVFIALIMLKDQALG
jgi:hypothetical protein